LDYLAVPLPAHLQGVSLMPLLGGGNGPPAEVMSSWREDGLQSFRRGDFKLIRRRAGGEIVRRELYALRDDPLEQHDRAQSDRQTVQELEQQLERTVTAAQQFHAERRRGRPVVPNADTMERLRALGY
jgi:arylsulfatase A-like enzyme